MPLDLTFMIPLLSLSFLLIPFDLLSVWRILISTFPWFLTSYSSSFYFDTKLFFCKRLLDLHEAIEKRDKIRFEKDNVVDEKTKLLQEFGLEPFPFAHYGVSSEEELVTPIVPDSPETLESMLPFKKEEAKEEIQEKPDIVMLGRKSNVAPRYFSLVLSQWDISLIHYYLLLSNPTNIYLEISNYLLFW